MPTKKLSKSISEWVESHRERAAEAIKVLEGKRVILKKAVRKKQWYLQGNCRARVIEKWYIYYSVFTYVPFQTIRVYL